MAFIARLPVQPGVPQACPQAAEGSHLEWKVKENPKLWEQGQQSLIPSTPRTPASLHTVILSPHCTHSIATTQTTATLIGPPHAQCFLRAYNGSRN